ncbi:signal peptide peptidase SppA [Thermococcus argininiproducens]|uniref:Signal peptide peptidase SppA n=1 Tax=Thermococcus argininiproducens TaxID=2866384 RepID=A0A9E7M9D1_9EURY|nr:signal peptide peptidase SppA [Thermococcus argininiproducens]USG99032.1 signal peptide peptidase SppA [Thermococcus argininiproducens]
MEREVWKYLSFILMLLLALAAVGNVLLYINNNELQRAIQERANITVIYNETVREIESNATLALQAKIDELQRELEYIKSQLRANKTEKSNATIAILPVVGPIDESTAVTTISKIRQIRKDDNVVGVILWIESPGGYVGPVITIYKELRKLSYEKPIVVYTGGLAASGGYFLACAADKIIADPLAEVGSIGVIYVHYNLEQNYAQNGIKVNVFKTGKYKDMGAEWRDLTDEEREMIKNEINTYFEYFLQVVSEGRKLDMNTTRQYGDGRVWFASEVKGTLVDETGDLDYAITVLENMLGIKSANVVLYDTQKIDFGIYESSSLYMPSNYVVSYIRR